MASPILLAKNAIRAINSGISCNDLDLTVQIIDIKPLSGNHYRLAISDGDVYAQALVGALILQKFLSGEIVQYQAIKIKEYSIKNVCGHSILVIEDLEPDIIIDSILGTPTKFELNFEENRN